MLHTKFRENRPAGSSSFFLFSFLIQCYVPFEISSLIEKSQSIGGAKREYPVKTN